MSLICLGGESDLWDFFFCGLCDSSCSLDTYAGGGSDLWDFSFFCGLCDSSCSLDICLGCGNRNWQKAISFST